MRFIAIDFETYYNSKTGCSVKDLGPEGYVNHIDFGTYLVALYDGTWSWVGNPKDMPWREIEKEPFFFVAHNARFDLPVFQSVINRLIFDAISFNVTPDAKFAPAFSKGDCKGWICTADMAAYFRSPRSLKDAAKNLLGAEVDKTKRDEMDGVVFNTLSDEKKAAMADYCLKDAKLSWEICHKYYDKWPGIERLVSEINRSSGIDGVGYDMELSKRILQHCFGEKTAAEKDIPWEYDDDKTPLSITKVRAHCATVGVPAPLSMAEDDEGCMAWEEANGAAHPFVAALRRWRKANIIEKRVKAMAERVIGSRPILTYSEKYFGSHTGRFSGENRVNVVNQPKAKIEELGGVSVRNLLIPRAASNVFCIVDWAQIEPRILLTLSGDGAALNLIRGGMSVYEVHARTTMGWTGGSLKVEDEAGYKMAKAQRLGLQYQCGAARFIEYSLVEHGIVVGLDEAKEIVANFRALNPLNVALWHKLNYEAKCCCARAMPLEIKLPSWRSLVYDNLRHDPVRGLLGDPAIGTTRKIYGGLLTENVVQAIARDIFVEKMTVLHNAGYPCSFHVHDEYVMEIGGDTATRERAEVEIPKLLREPVAWLPSCPLDVDIQFSPFYKK